MESPARKPAIQLRSTLSGLVVGLALVASPATSAPQPRPTPAVSPSDASAPSPEALTQSLRALALRYQAAGPGERDEVLRELDGVARARQRALAALSETEPAAVLRLAVPSGLRASLPGAVQPYLEHEVELDGVLEVLVEDRDPWPNAVQSANWTCVGLCAHESAMKGGKIVKLPAFTRA